MDIKKITCKRNETDKSDVLRQTSSQRNDTINYDKQDKV